VIFQKLAGWKPALQFSAPTFAEESASTFYPPCSILVVRKGREFHAQKREAHAFAKFKTRICWQTGVAQTLLNYFS
jgi:hypothetical protein